MAYGDLPSGFDAGLGNLAGSGLNPSYNDVNYNFDFNDGSYSLGGSSDYGLSSMDFAASPSLADASSLASLTGQPTTSTSDDWLNKLSKVFGFINPNASRAVGLAGSASRFAQDPSMKTGVNLLGKGVGGPMGSIASMFTSGDPSKSWGSGAGSMLGGAMLGPIGGLLGGMLGSNLLEGVNPNGEKMSAEGLVGNQSNPLNAENIIKGLGTIYSMSQASGGGGASGANAAVQQQMNQLASMYGQDSPYAQALRQRLERKDAAAGRRSQYGPREVELQAALADKATQAASAMNGLAGTSFANSMAMKNYKDKQRAQMLSSIYGMGKQFGVFDKLNGMFAQRDNTPSYDVKGNMPYLMNALDNPTNGSLLEGTDWEY